MFNNRCSIISPDGVGCIKLTGHQSMGSWPCQNPFNHPRGADIADKALEYPKKWCGVCLEYRCDHLETENVPDVFKDAFGDETA